VAICGIHAIDQQWQTVAVARAAAVAGQQFAEIILMQQADRGIIHFLDFQAILLLVGSANIEELLLQVR
jgi:hypothetical protein